VRLLLAGFRIGIGGTFNMPLPQNKVGVRV